MATELPYMTSVKNLLPILDRMKAAGTPPKFTYEFLKTSLGFPSSNDRSVLRILKALGFLTADGTPTARYNEFRDESRSGLALAVGLREGWAPLFLSDERAFVRTSGQLTELMKGLTGATEAVAQKMASTFKAIAAKAKWDEQPDVTKPVPPILEAPVPPQPGPDAGRNQQASVNLHHDVHIHLPATSDVAVYTAIFRAVRDELIN
jgi:hypothetical protein